MMSEDDFSNWYNDLVEKAGLCDKRYPIKGMNIWTAYGWKVMSLVDSFTRAEMERTNHGEVCFPLLIPEDQFAREEKHIKGFGSEVYWVTHAGDNPLDIKLVVRPTSETAMYPIFSLWVRAHTDLPLKVYQMCNVFRYETKQTRAFVRMREIHFFEAHTCHTDFEDAERQMAQDMEIMDNVSKALCLPHFKHRRPDWDKFAGAHYSVGIDCYMPTGRTVQIGGIHQYKDNFAKAYDIKYEAADGEHKHVHQTTYGMSERLVGAIVAIHGDENGLKLPPAVAPIQVVIVPILAKEGKDDVSGECEKVRAELAAAGVRVHLDDRDLRPGNKYYDWELKGVPLRLELGGRDIKSQSVLSVRRDTREKAPIARAELVSGVRAKLEAIQKSMWDDAQAKLAGGTVDVKSLDGELPKAVLRMAWCGENACGQEIEAKTGLNILGTSYRGEACEGGCVKCGSAAKTYLYAAKTY